jgi:hypothetical protein
VRAVAEEQRGIEGGEIRAELVVIPLERRPRGIDDEAAEHGEDEQRFPPPRIPALCVAEATRDYLDRNDLPPTASGDG